ncbi:MAG: hypothetical protein ABEI97_02840, partial [Candidatus Nanohaloarchaea archaeon]
GSIHRLFLLLVLVAAALIGGTTAAAAISPLDVLIVNDGHNISGDAQLPEDRYLSTYKTALSNGVRNVNITVENVSAVGLGPSRQKMANHDIVIWYTLGDYEGFQYCPESGTVTTGDTDQSECRTFYGNPDDPGGGGGDVQNITSYLRNDRGRMFVTGHRVHFKNKRTAFERKVFEVVHGSTERTIYECKPQAFWYDCDEISKSNINDVLMGEQNDPVTKDTFFRPVMDTSIEPLGERGIFVDDEDASTADDNLRWRHPKENNDRFYAVDTDDDGDLDEYTHSMVRTNKSTYKTVYAAFGFEAIDDQSDRRQLMNWTINYLAGPRVDQTTVSDNDDITGTSVNESRYTSGSVNVTGRCINRQRHTGTGLSAAQMFVENDTDIPSTPRSNALGDGYTMDASDDTFDSRREDVNYTGYDAAANLDGNGGSGSNYTVAVQCRDSTNQQYWGQYEESWIVVDEEAPNAPDDLLSATDYSSTTNVSVTVDYQETSEPFRADLVRFSCDDATWTSWREYDDSATSQDFEVNLTRTTPDLVTPIDPVNASFIRETDNITVNATDSIAGVQTGSSHSFYNGTLNQSFTVNQSFDPDYVDAGAQTLLTYILDKASNTLHNFFTFDVDLAPPDVEKTEPGNTTVIQPGDNVTVTAADRTANVSRFAAFNGTHWDNTTVNEANTTQEVDPAWTGETTQFLTIWLNDSVDRTTTRRYHYPVDGSPPRFLSVTPANTSVVQSSDEVTIDIVDTGAAGIDTAQFNLGHGSNQSFTANQSFDPGWTTEGDHNITAWSTDTLGLSNRTYLEYTVDDTDPSYDSFTPSTTTTYINASQNITVTVSDGGGASIDHRIFYNESENRTFTSGTEFDPGWTREGIRTLSLWVND